jgi:L-alanine-DL-glutamate epimerase-like enolase superfamily enzyme
MPRITVIETAIPHGIMPNLLLVRVHTDDGLVGCGETYYTPHAIAALVHDWMAARLLGADALAVESHWRWLFERCTPFGHPGAELRALSAIDLALWDLLGQATGQPVYRLLGGPVRERIPVYNTCGGPAYGALKEAASAHPGWPGYGSEGRPGPLEDTWASLNAPGDLAAALVEEGYPVVKLWPFDRAAHRSGGLHISWQDVEEGMRPLREIRDRVGMKLDIAIEGHAFYHLPAALREIRPLWVEDLLRPDCVATLADFRQRSGLPIAASEMLLGRKEYLQVLQAGAADYCMVDPTWSGGISESRRVIDMAQTFNVPATIHDCTGPLTLFAGLHLAAASTNVVFQETVRAHIRTLYGQLVDRGPVVERGAALLPEGPGLGTRFHDALFTPGVDSYRRSG